MRPSTKSIKTKIKGAKARKQVEEGRPINMARGVTTAAPMLGQAGRNPQQAWASFTVAFGTNSCVPDTGDSLKDYSTSERCGSSGLSLLLERRSVGPAMAGETASRDCRLELSRRAERIAAVARDGTAAFLSAAFLSRSAVLDPASLSWSASLARSQPETRKAGCTQPAPVALGSTIYTSTQAVVPPYQGLSKTFFASRNNGSAALALTWHASCLESLFLPLDFMGCLVTLMLV